MRSGGGFFQQGKKSCFCENNPFFLAAKNAFSPLHNLKNPFGLEYTKSIPKSIESTCPHIHLPFEIDSEVEYRYHEILRMKIIGLCFSSLVG